MVPIGDKIYFARLGKHLTQHQLARSAGIPQPNLSNIEKGKQDLTVTTLRRIAYALEIPVAEFFESNSPEKPLALTRSKIEKIAKAIAGGNVRLTDRERKIVEWFKSILPRQGKKTAKVKTMHQSWMELRKEWSSSEINTLYERVKDAQRRSAGKLK